MNKAPTEAAPGRRVYHTGFGEGIFGHNKHPHLVELLLLLFQAIQRISPAD